MTLDARLIPSEAEQIAAAVVLDRAGRVNHWWPKDLPKFEQLDPIGREEFLEIVEEMLVAAARVRQSGLDA